VRELLKVGEHLEHSVRVVQWTNLMSTSVLALARQVKDVGEQVERLKIESRREIGNMNE